jgi:hypothetical protein
MEYDKERFENSKVCKNCGGICCKNAPCCFMPDDFEDLSAESLIQLFEELDQKSDEELDQKGDKEQAEKQAYMCIKHSYVQGIYERRSFLFICMRGKGWKRYLGAYDSDNPENNACILWNPENGCPFSFEKRPSGGKAVIPSEETPGHCKSVISMKDLYLAWKPYEGMLIRVLEYFAEKQP